MPKRKPRVPAYRLHPPTGQAVATLDGKDYYLGKHATPASSAEYDRLISEWLSQRRRVLLAGGGETVVAELLAAYLKHVEGYY